MRRRLSQWVQWCPGWTGHEELSDGQVGSVEMSRRQLLKDASYDPDLSRKQSWNPQLCREGERTRGGAENHRGRASFLGAFSSVHDFREAMKPQVSQI